MKYSVKWKGMERNEGMSGRVRECIENDDNTWEFLLKYNCKENVRSFIVLKLGKLFSSEDLDKSLLCNKYTLIILT